MEEVYANDCLDLNFDTVPLDDLLAQDKTKCFEEDQSTMWYHGKLSRSDAEQMLREANDRHPHLDKDGVFIVRDSTSSDINFSLSLIHNDRCYHFSILRHKEGYYYIDGGPLIHGLEKLIEHYIEHVDKLPTYLSKICKGNPPPATTRRCGPTNILHKAVMNKREDVIKRMLDHPLCPDIDAKNQNGSTALHDAVSLGLEKSVALLLQKNADIRIKDIDGHTPLHKACAADMGSICTALVSHSPATIVEKNPANGWVPLHVAAMHGHLECVEILLNSKAPIFPRSLNDETPVELAETYRRNNCVKVLENFKDVKALVANQDFFHPELDRQGAETLVKSHHKVDGLFVIRKSKSIENQNVLSLCHKEGVFNYEIKSKMYRGHRVHYIDTSPYHPSLFQLVQYYHYFDEGTPVKLQAYINKNNEKVDLVIDNEKVDLVKDNEKIDLVNTADYSFVAADSKPTRKPLPPLKTHPPPPRPQLPTQPPELQTPVPRQTHSNPLVQNIENGPEPFVDIPVKNLKKGHQLGEGEYGSVLKGVLIERKPGFLRREKHTDVAIKTFHSVGSIDDFRREAHVMQSLQHHFIVQLLGVCQSNPLMLVEEFVPMGSMLDYLEDHPQKVRVKEELYLWAAQIAMGMMYLETKSLVHRDLAARNILLKSLQHVKISDFGLSRAMGSDKEYYKASKGGRWPIKWYAPESVNFGHFSHASDVWSYGVTLWEMFTYGQAPFENMSGVEVIRYIEEGKRLSRPEKCTPAVYQIMTQCWSLKPEDRPTFTQLNHMFDEDPEYVSTKEILSAIKASRYS